MPDPQSRETGLKLGLISFGVVMLGFVGLFLFGPAPSESVSKPGDQVASAHLLDI